MYKKRPISDRLSDIFKKKPFFDLTYNEKFLVKKNLFGPTFEVSRG